MNDVEPWTSAGNLVLDENRLTVARCASHEDAARIARECNAHAALVAALIGMRYFDCDDSAEARAARKAAHAALKLAKGRA